MTTQESTGVLPGLHVVTGAFGYTGRYIARRLLAMGARVLTLTGHPERAGELGGQVATAPFNFERPDELARTLAGADVLYNTYWVRFGRGQTSFERAVADTRVLIRAAERAGVRRLVHIGVTNASLTSPLPYFRGKAQVEDAIRSSALSYAVVRPTIIFGQGDILINNIAWLLRRLPVFGLLGDGRCRLQPVSAEDVAVLAVAAGQGRESELDAAGPDTFSYAELVRLIAANVGSRALIVPLWPPLALACARAIGAAMGDTLLTRDEAAALMSELLVSAEPPRGRERLSDWLRANAAGLGREFASEQHRPFGRVP